MKARTLASILILVLTALIIIEGYATELNIIVEIFQIYVKIMAS